MPFLASRAQKALGSELRTMRERSGLSLRQASADAGMSDAKISRIENATNKISAADVRTLGRLFGADEATIERLCAAAHDSITDAWWTLYDKWITPSFSEFLARENEAVKAWSLQPMFVPGLLQSPEYIKAVLTTGPTQDPDRADAEHEVRVHRQRRLREEPEPLVFNAFIGEPVLNWAFGGKGVLNAQLRHFRELADYPNISIRVISFDRPTTVYSLDLFEFEDGQSICFDETQWGTPIHDGALEVRHALRRLEHIQEVALSEEESNQLIERRIRETGSQ